MKHKIEALVAKAIRDAVESGELALEEIPEPSIERPREKEHGDWATSMAMKLAKQAHMNPRQIAEIISSHMAADGYIESIEVAGPGFINMRLSKEALHDVIREAREQGRDFGRAHIGDGKSIQVEFVSANPTGPMHVGHGRWAALGNALCNLLEHAGWEVQREFYINDAGSQMENFAQSVDARYMQLCGREVEFPENGYGGAYVTTIAQRILDAEGAKWVDVEAGERASHFKELAYQMMLAHMKDVLGSVGVNFDNWFSERTLYVKDADGMSPIDRIIARLDEGGYLFESEDATWFRTTDFGDDKDRVLVKSDGSYTYFTPDIAYHANKFARGFDRVIDIWGADHHGYVPRMQAAMTAIGNGGKLDVLLGQLVNLFRNGEAVRMSKRTGEMITFEELIEEVGADATKYLMLRKSTDQTLDFDIEEARQKKSSNPVFYVQYAHARIQSVFRQAAETGLQESDAFELLTDESELDLIKKIEEYPREVEKAAADLAPQRIARVAHEMASAFHSFYSRCRIMGVEPQLAGARLALAGKTAQVIRHALSILGVSAPEKM